MPVNTPCKTYDENAPQWLIVRDALQGEAAIKRKGEAYLPKPSGQDGEDYARYSSRAHFFDAAGRAAEGLHGGVFSKAPVQSGGSTERFAPLLKDVDAEGSGLDQFAADITWDAMQTNWGGVLVDYPNVSEETPLALIKGGAFLKWYNAESVINWRHETRGGKRCLSLVVLREDESAVKAGDEFIETGVERYRVLKLDQNGGYRQIIYAKDAGGGFAVRESVEPKMQGRRLSYIPFFTAPGKTPEKSMLLGLCFENIGHYQKTADYENGLHYVGTPTPVCENAEAPTRRNAKGEDVPLDISLGGSTFIFIKDRDHSNVRIKYLEFTGAGMEQLLSGLNSCEERMAILGARIVSAEKRGVEAAEAARIHRAGENGVLGAFARNMSLVITRAVRVMMEWNGFTPEECADWSYELNADYDLTQTGAQIVSAVLGAVAGGSAPRISGYNVLKKAGLVPEGMSYEEYLMELEAGRTERHAPGAEGG
jgi:hypothetical protein